jgi:tetratricopeptide (TPR) repeat protein/tRNA A-37 threonylcarbamoyl transferase component Bud32
MDWERVKEAVADALEAPGDQREAIIERALASTPAALEQARRLIRSHTRSQGVIDPRTDAWLGIGGPDVLALGGMRIGRYTLESLVAEGAMAAVYRARQAVPERVVALKLFRTSLPMVDARSRFRREADALARLKHPNIASIHEANVHPTSDGHAIPFIAMEFVEGVPLTTFARQRNLSRTARIDLIVKVALAVQAAHQHAVIHRDLKPANVLVEDSGEPKVLDFGIARIASGDPTRATWQTTGGVLLGTPGYMSPEQIGTDPEAVDLRADVWSLGVLLYELLVGRLPIESTGGSIHDVLRRLEQAEPTAIRSIDPTLDLDLSTVVHTALQRDVSRRYATAQALADDLRRYLRHQPVEARPATTIYLASKFVRRNRIPMAVLSAFVSLLATALVVSSIGFVRADRARLKAEAAEKQAVVVRNFIVGVLGSADPYKSGRDVTVLETIRALLPRIGPELADAPQAEADVRSMLGRTLFQLGDYAEAEKQQLRAVELLTHLSGSTHVATINERLALIESLRWLYKPAEAQAHAEALKTDIDAGPGRDSDEYLLLNAALAGIASDVGDNDAARALYERTIAVATARGPEAAGELATARNNLALVELSLANAPRAVELLNLVLDHRVSAFGANYPGNILARSNLASAYAVLGQNQEALDQLNLALAQARGQLGDEHADTLSVKRELGSVYAAMGRLDESASTLLDVAQTTERVYGTDSERLALALNEYGRTLYSLGRFADAVEVFARACDIQRAQLQADANPIQLEATMRNHAMALSSAGRADEAIAVLEPLMHRTIEREGERGIPAMFAFNGLAMAYVDAKRPAEAEPLIRKALAIAQANDSDGINVAMIRRNLGRALIDLDRFDEAEVELLQAWARFENEPGLPGHRTTLLQLRRVYEAKGDAEQLAKFKALAESP